MREVSREVGPVELFSLGVRDQRRHHSRPVVPAIKLLALVRQVHLPARALLANGPKAALPACRAVAIMLIAGAIGYPQVRSAIVRSVSVDVVDPVLGLRIHQVTMEIL